MGGCKCIGLGGWRYLRCLIYRYRMRFFNDLLIHLNNEIMRQVKQVFYLSLVAMLIGILGSCSQGRVRPDNHRGVEAEELLASGLRGITFTFSLSGQDPHMVSTARALHDAPEWAIDNLYLLEFDSNTDVLLNAPIQIDEMLKYVQNSQAQFTYTVPEKDITSATIRKFFFVANLAKLPESIKKGAMLSDVQNALIKATGEDLKEGNESKVLLTSNTKPLEVGRPITSQVDNGYRIPMTGFAVDSNKNKSILYQAGGHATVELVRVVARVDIVNRNPNLVIKEVKLNNTFSNSYLHTDFKSVVRRSLPFVRVSGILPFAKIPNDFRGNRTKPNVLQKLFYLYEGENSTDPDECVTLEMKAEYKGKEETFLIPFKRKNAQTGKFTEPVDIKRNHLYRFVIGSEDDFFDTGNISIVELTEEEWTRHHLNEEFSAIDFTLDANQDHFKRYNPAEAKLSVPALPAGGEISYTLTMKTGRAGHQKFEVTALDAEATWATAKVTSSGSGASKKEQLHFTVKKNDSDKKRVARFQVSSGSLQYSIYVEQAANI